MELLCSVSHANETWARILAEQIHNSEVLRLARKSMTGTSKTRCLILQLDAFGFYKYQKLLQGACSVDLEFLPFS